MYVHIKSDDRRRAEAASLREFGVDPRRATAQQREYAEQIAADNRRINKQLNHMEEKYE